MLKYYILLVSYILVYLSSVAFMLYYYQVIGIEYVVIAIILGLLGIIAFTVKVMEKLNRYKYLRKVKQNLTKVSIEDDAEVIMQLKRIAQAEWDCKH